MNPEGISPDQAEEYHIPWASPGQEFHFLQAVTVVFDTGMQLETPQDLIEQLPNLSHGSIYYHFVEARRRTENRQDDFTAWLSGFEEDVDPLLKALAGVEFYFLTLPELKANLIEAVGRVARESVHE